MTTAMLGAQIVIGNDVAELRRMTQWLWTNAAVANIPQELAVQLDICANEVVTNIISYAYDEAGHRDITLELSKTAQGACLVIRDDGKPFNFVEVPKHQAPESLDEAEVGGLGIHLVRRLTTRCDYQRDGSVNVLTLEVQPKPNRHNA